MPGQIADLRAKVSIDGAEQAKKDLKELKGGSGAGGNGVLDLASSFKTGLGAVSGFITGFVGFKVASDALGLVKDQLLDVLQAGMDQQKVQAQTAAVIKSTGGAAHLTAAQIGEMADKLAGMSGISDDTIQASENLLLTFRAIGRDTFPVATQAILDMSVAMHEDLQSATIQVGKALQDPIHGVTTLQRVGVQLSQGQKDLITHFMATGQAAKAQSVILDELNKEFGGSAKAAGETLPGQLAILNVKFDQAKEKIGLAVIPIIQKLIDKYLMPLADWLGAHLPAAIDTLTGFIDNTLLPAINGLMNSPFVKTIEGWAQALADKLAPQLGDSGLAGHVATARDRVASLNTHVDTTGKNMSGEFVDRVQKAIDRIDGMTNSLGGETPDGKGLNPAVLRINANLTKTEKAQDALTGSQAKAAEKTQFLGGVFDGLGQAVGGALGAIGNFAAGISERFGPALPAIQQILASIQSDFSLFGEGVHNVWDGLWAVLSAPVRAAFTGVQTIIFVALDLLAGRWDKAGEDARAGFGKMFGIVQDSLAGIGRIIIGFGQMLLGWIAAPFLQLWKNTQPLLEGFKNDFINWWNNLGPNLKHTIDNWGHMIQDYINDHMPKFPGISLPGGFPGRASGGSISGDFIGAERGMELLVTPGVYHAPPGSYVYNNQQTQQLLSGGGASGRGGLGGNNYTYNIYPQQAMIDTAELARIQRRRDLLLGMRS